MKKNIVLLLLLFIGSLSNAQLIESVYFGADIKYKYEQMIELLPTKYLLDEDLRITYDDYSIPLYLGLRFRDRYFVEFGYLKEFYMAGYMTDNPIDLVEGGANSIDIIHHLFINGGITLFRLGKFSISPMISFLYGKSEYAYNRPLQLPPYFNGKDNEGNYIITYSLNEWKVDNGLHKHYFFISPSIKLSYRVYNGLYLHFKSGYNKGFKTMGYYRGYFQINNEPKEYIENETKGNNYFFSIGLNFNFQLKEKPKIEKSEFVKIIEFDKDLNYDFGVNLSTDIFSDGINRYVLPSYGPIFKINYGLLGFSTSILFAKINSHLHKDDVISRYDYNNGTTSVYDIFLKYRTIESVSFIRYSIYKGRKWKISPGLGFFITFPKDKGTYYTLQHSDGKNIRNGFYFFSIPHFHFWGLTPNVEVEYLLNKTVKVGFNMGVKYIPFYNSYMEQALYNVDRKPIFPVNFGLNVCYYIKK